MIAATPTERRPLGTLGAGSQRDGEFGEERDFRGRIHGQWNGAKHNPEVGQRGVLESWTSGGAGCTHVRDVSWLMAWMEDRDERKREEGADPGQISEEAPLKGGGRLRREREPLKYTEKEQPKRARNAASWRPRESMYVCVSRRLE